MTAPAPRRSRVLWMDVMRLVCAFLVIVNHTNSPIYNMTTPANGSWWASLLWYYIAKPAVPIFVMISGACLLPRVDSYRRNMGRVLHMFVVLMVFSYMFFIYDAWVLYGIWPRIANIAAFLDMVRTATCGDAFWYLYFYMGLLLMLPLLQRMASAMKRRDTLYLMGMCFVVSAVWPLITHFAPQLEVTPYFDMPLFSIYIGLFFAGHYIHQSKPTTRKQMAWAALTLVLSLALSVALTRIEYDRVPSGEKYWFMDHRMHPSATTTAAAVSMVLLARGLFSRTLSGRPQRAMTELAACAFGIYLLEEVVIYLTRGPIYVPLCNYMPAIFAVLIWEAAVFAISLTITWLLRRVPLVKKLL